MQKNGIDTCADPCQVLRKGHDVLVSDLGHQADCDDSLESSCSPARNRNYPDSGRLLMKNAGPPHRVLPNPVQMKGIFPHTG